MTDLRKILASNMKLLRKCQGYSQARLAEAVNTADNYIALIESGKRFPSVTMLEKIAVALKVDTVELFSMKPDKIPEKKALKARILEDIDQILANRLDELIN
jgi:transcriptional regulator with XRE-family HTH domain